jgi:3-phosphoshikimate 1-carboxyvinyltransferase
MTSGVTFRLQAGGRLKGDIRVPGDKSISHRSIMLGSVAQGRSAVTGFLDGEDCLATVAAFRAMGVSIARPDATSVVIDGVGLRGLRPPSGPMDMGNSGTGMRLLTGVLAGQPFDSTLVGDASLSRRPMRRVTEPLTQMGALIETSAQGTPPLHVRGGRILEGRRHELAIASAQVKSAILLAGLWAAGETSVVEPAPTRDHTERMLQAFGAEVRRSGSESAIQAAPRLEGIPIDVPADLSSAAFFLVGAAIAPGSDLVLRHVGINPTRTGVIEILRRMGATIEILEPREVGAEPVADLRVRYSELKGIEIPRNLVPLAIDEFPAVFIAAACAEGETLLTGAEELRVKESDRIQVMADGLKSLGVECEVLPDGIRIAGSGGFTGGSVDSHGDHRIAMAFAMAALRARSAILIHDCDNVATSFPGFAELAQSCGLDITA